jgi:Aspartyl protease
MHFSKSVVLGFAALILSACAEARLAKSSTVPFELYRGHIYVTAFVNGKGPYRFVFDTGASGMGRADRRLVSELSLRKVGEEQNSDGINVAAIDVVSADSIRLGSVEKRRVRLLSRDYNLHRKPTEAPLMGIIGRDFYRDRLLTIDYPKRTIRFSDGALKPGDPGVVAYKPSFRIPVCFAVGCYDGKVDSGSNESIIIPKALVGRVSAAPPVHVGSGTSANTVFEMYEMQLAEPVHVSGVTAPNPKVLYSDPSDETINIGSDFLKDYVLTIDQRHHLLKISRPESN